MRKRLITLVLTFTALHIISPIKSITDQPDSLSSWIRTDSYSSATKWIRSVYARKERCRIVHKSRMVISKTDKPIHLDSDPVASSPDMAERAGQAEGVSSPGVGSIMDDQTFKNGPMLNLGAMGHDSLERQITAIQAIRTHWRAFGWCM